MTGLIQFQSQRTKIAAFVGSSHPTAQKHSENIYSKLGAENRTAAACTALDFLAGFRV